MVAYQREEAEALAIVRRPGVVRLTEAALHLRGEAALARCRGETMTELAKTFSAEGVNASVSVVEPDGATWSMSVGLDEHAVRDDVPEAGQRS